MEAKSKDSLCIYILFGTQTFPKTLVFWLNTEQGILIRIFIHRLLEARHDNWHDDDDDDETSHLHVSSMTTFLNIR